MGANTSKSSGTAAAEEVNSPGETASAQKTFEKFPELPDELAKQVFRALPINEKGALARTSSYYFRLFSQHIYTVKLLMLVAHGEQEPAAHMLARTPGLLVERADVTDYSGRTFKNITAYEYAYWAKDTHMCRMLETHMDEKTKAAMREKVTAMDTVGLTYEHHGDVVNHSGHFDMTPLKTVLQNCVTGYGAWHVSHNFDAIRAAWMEVGLAQRDLPVHVINEYCRPDRSFYPLPAFNEDTLPRILTYHNFNADQDVPFFPLVFSGSSQLGADWALERGDLPKGSSAERDGCRHRWVQGVSWARILDLEAVIRLDEVRTADLTRSRTNLGLIEPERDHGARLLL